MIVSSVIIGRNLAPRVEFTANSSGVYLQDPIINQKIKLSERIKDGTDLIARGGFGDGEKKYHIRVWELTSCAQLPLIPTMNNLSFNPFIYGTRENSDEENTVALMFLTIDTATYKLLKYESKMEIITTLTNTRKNTVSCLCRYKIGDEFTLSLKKDAVDKREKYEIFTIKVPEKLSRIEAGFTQPTTKEEIHKFSKYEANRNRRPLHFFYSAKEIPRYILCHESEKEEFLKRIAKYTNREEEYFYVTTVPDDINGDNRLMLTPLCSNELKLTKGVICSSTLDLSSGVCRDLGLNYVFTLYQRRRSGEDYLKVSRSR